ncbi:MAG: hypothetical protein E5Y50_34035 [Mesorhizobium sp.]|nr:MAG: hypothetical protein E5Y50_34035 [Mesorhizobium sp.]
MGGGEHVAPSALLSSYPRSAPMSPSFDASKSLTTLDQDSTLVAVIEMSQTKWLIAATAIASATGRRAPAPSSCASTSSGRAPISPVS